MENVPVHSMIKFSSDEVKELENVYNILGHSKQIMTEIGLCTGIDYDGYGVTEASCVQIAFHIGVNLDLTNSFRTEAAITKYIELGGSEALIYYKIKKIGYNYTVAEGISCQTV